MRFYLPEQPRLEVPQHAAGVLEGAALVHPPHRMLLDAELIALLPQDIQEPVVVWSSVHGVNYGEGKLPFREVFAVGLASHIGGAELCKDTEIDIRRVATIISIQDVRSLYTIRTW
jgi:hypothetical protein